MRIVVFTGNQLRHKFLANTLIEHAGEGLVISETKPSDAVSGVAHTDAIREHFNERYQTERAFFGEHEVLRYPSVPILLGEANLPHVHEAARACAPDAVIAFGCSLLKEPLLSIVPHGRFLNLHLGLSPYYRGSGTNFWPFVNRELQYVGSTILHIDPGVDTGDIAAHVRPSFEKSDTVHTVGSKVIKESVSVLASMLDVLKAGGAVGRTTQWKIADARYYRKRDFTEEALRQYHVNMKEGVIDAYIANPSVAPRTISFAG